MTKAKLTKLTAVVTSIAMAAMPLTVHAEAVVTDDSFIANDLPKAYESEPPIQDDVKAPQVIVHRTPDGVETYETIYEPINWAFPYNPNNPFEIEIEERGYYLIETISPEPTRWDLIYQLDGSLPSDVYIRSFSGKMRHQVVICSPGTLRLQGTGDFFAKAEPYDATGLSIYLVPPIPVHRLYNNDTGEHFFTTNESEMATLVSLGWTYEGIAFNSMSWGSTIYRNYDGKRHSYTYDYRDDTEGFAFKLPEDAHRLISPDNDTLITTNEKEYWDLLKLGWEDRTC